MHYNARRRKALAVGAGLLFLASACSNGADGSGAASPGGNDEIDSGTIAMQGWPDVCEVFDPDAVTAQMHIEGYTEGPSHLGTTEGNFPGALKCNSSYDFPDYPDTEEWGELNGWMYMVLAPYGSSEEAADAYQASYDDAIRQLRERPEKEQVVDREIEGEWDRAAILSSVGAGNSTRVFYLKESYYVFIEIGYKPDPGVGDGLAYTDMDTFEDPTYEFTPPELADWFEAEYLPQLYTTISNKLEE